MPTVWIFIISAFVLLIGLTVLTVRGTIHRALRKTIIPDIDKKGFEYVNYKWCGIFGTGDFDEKISIGPAFSNGSPTQSIYIDVFYRSDKDSRNITARIDAIFFFIRQVKYSSNL